MNKLTQPFAWTGSKVKASKHIIPIINKIKRSCYVEPFGGSGAVLCAKRLEENEVYNDLNSLVTNFFEILRNPKSYNKIKQLAIITPASRKFWKQFRDYAIEWERKNYHKCKSCKSLFNLDNLNINEVSAFATFYCQNVGYSGSCFQSFGGGCYTPCKGWKNRIDNLDSYRRRFMNVTIENLQWTDCIKKYDKPTTLFYCDPPYESSSSVKYKFSHVPLWDKTELLVETLCNIKGNCILSCYNNNIFKKLLNYGYNMYQFKHIATSAIDHNVESIETLYVKGLVDKEEN